MTLMLLWEEHCHEHPDEPTHRYSQFCENYRRYAKTLKRSMRQIHRAGEKLFVDYAGPVSVHPPYQRDCRSLKAWALTRRRGADECVLVPDWARACH